MKNLKELIVKNRLAFEDYTFEIENNSLNHIDVNDFYRYVEIWNKVESKIDSTPWLKEKINNLNKNPFTYIILKNGVRINSFDIMFFSYRKYLVEHITMDDMVRNSNIERNENICIIFNTNDDMEIPYEVFIDQKFKANKFISFDDTFSIRELKKRLKDNTYRNFNNVGLTLNDSVIERVVKYLKE